MVEQFQFQHSHLFQLVYEAHKEGILDQFEKIKIKGKTTDLNTFPFRGDHCSESRAQYFL